MMRRFLTNIMMFLTILAVFYLIGNHFSNPYYGNPRHVVKFDFLKKNTNKFNTVIFGSSRLYRHLNPKIFDRVLDEYQTSTFNLANAGHFCPENYYLYEKFLETANKNEFKYSLVELSPLIKIADQNLNTPKNYYWHNLKYFSFAVKFIWSSKYPKKTKRWMLKNYSISYINSIFFGLKSLFSNRITEKRRKLDNHYNGFYSLEDNMKDIEKNLNLKNRREDFLKNNTILKKKNRIATSAFSLKNHRKFLNVIHLKKLKYLIKKSKLKGIQLIFIIPPRLSNYNEVLALKKELPANHIIEMANPKKYPELYKLEYSFDKGHLNNKGSNLFTKYLAEKLKTKCF